VRRQHSSKYRQFRRKKKSRTIVRQTSIDTIIITNPVRNRTWNSVNQPLLKGLSLLSVLNLTLLIGKMENCFWDFAMFFPILFADTVECLKSKIDLPAENIADSCRVLLRNPAHLNLQEKDDLGTIVVTRNPDTNKGGNELSYNEVPHRPGSEDRRRAQPDWPGGSKQWTASEPTNQSSAHSGYNR